MLKPNQIKALELILLGLSDHAVAGKIGMDRSTIARWRKEEEFSLELAMRLKELKMGMNEKLLFLANKSLLVCEEALGKGNTKVALALIRRFDVLNEKDNESNFQLPQIHVTLKQAEHNYTLDIDDIIAHNKALPEPDKDLIELGKELRNTNSL